MCSEGNHRHLFQAGQPQDFPSRRYLDPSRVIATAPRLCYRPPPIGRNDSPWTPSSWRTDRYHARHVAPPSRAARQLVRLASCSNGAGGRSSLYGRAGGRVQRTRSMVTCECRPWPWPQGSWSIWSMALPDWRSRGRFMSSVKAEAGLRNGGNQESQKMPGRWQTGGLSCRVNQL